VLEFSGEPGLGGICIFLDCCFSWSDGREQKVDLYLRVWDWIGLGWAEVCWLGQAYSLGRHFSRSGRLDVYSLYGRSSDRAKETTMFDGRKVAVTKKKDDIKIAFSL
jgi:hypothetical protein